MCCCVIYVTYLLCGQLTISQIKEFAAELHKFKERFRLHGPGSVGQDLDKGFFNILSVTAKDITGFQVVLFHQLFSAHNLLPIPGTYKVGNVSN